MHVNENGQTTSAILAALKPTELAKKQNKTNHMRQSNVPTNALFHNRNTPQK